MVTVIVVLLERLLASPEYVATIVWEPTVRLQIVKLADPLTTFAVPRTVFPSLNVTVPVGELPEILTARSTQAPTLAETEGAGGVTVVGTWLAVLTATCRPERYT